MPFLTSEPRDLESGATELRWRRSRIVQVFGLALAVYAVVISLRMAWLSVQTAEWGFAFIFFALAAGTVLLTIWIAIFQRDRTAFLETWIAEQESGT